ncbi:hypothetical protein LTR56_019790 [Elasticomyces elasticus]|nr:hypothetical protein LTR56_019790 [Elasticomyces elasticus]KAK3633542.1 hypothetical protein LTR22_020054 [Elasticomyces elasticus]KAK4910770.1 hypothetical protein LTR49_020622 [Elasticomyces elasticus]KAK5762245.1 hypothetical protein LTS12_007588 [Elasticomyces elasticus]
MSARPLIAPLRQVARRTRPATRSLHQLPIRPQPVKPPQCLHQQHRRAGTFTSNASSLFRQNPFSVSLAVLAILAGAGGLAYANYLYKYYITAAFHNYPEPVAQKLRKALYYTNSELDPKEAIKYYRQALQVAQEISMDPFSDEIIGVKIQVAKLMEEVKQIRKSAQVLEILRNDCLEWMKQLGEKEHNRTKRTRVLSKLVGISVKLGELYGSPEVYDREMAEERLVWAVETVLKERQRRDNIRSTEHISEEALIGREGPWMTNSETGAALEALAHTYEENDQHYLASPLFLQALNLYPTKDCHAVILMNNLGSSLAQQSPRAARATAAYASSTTIASSQTPSGPVATRESMLQNASMWAQKALDIAAKIQPPTRNKECDVGCAVATHNLGEFAEMLGNNAEARKKYTEAISIARAVGFQDGVDNSSARLRALSE